MTEYHGQHYDFEPVKMSPGVRIPVPILVGGYSDAALHRAAVSGTPETIAALLNAGANVNARDGDGRTALHWAAGYGTPENIAALLNAGASGSIKNKRGETPFDLAKENNAVEGTDVYWALNDAQYK